MSAKSSGSNTRFLYRVLSRLEMRNGAANLVFLSLLLLGAAISFAVWSEQAEREKQLQELAFDYEAKEAARELKAYMGHHEQALRGMVGLVCGSEYVSTEEWHDYLSYIRPEALWPSIMVMGVAQPYFEAGDDDLSAQTYAFFRRIRSLFVFETTQILALSQLVINYDRDFEERYGESFWSSPALVEAFSKARRTGTQSLSTLMRLDAGGKEVATTHFLASVLPYYEECQISDEAEARIRAHRGWVYAVFEVAPFIAPAFRLIDPQVSVQVVDETGRLIIDSTGATSRIKPTAYPYFRSLSLQLYEHRWLLHVYSESGVLRNAAVSTSTYSLLLGLVGSLLFALLVSRLLQRLNRADDIAEARADALREAEASLESNVLELQRSNTELARFVYVACHDLKAPLRAIRHLANWSLEDFGTSIQQELRQNIEKIRDRSVAMARLLDDLLQYSHVGQTREPFSRIELSEIVEQQKALLDIPEGFEIDVLPSPPIEAPRTALEQALRNLIQNAVTHHHKEHGRVTVEGRRCNGHYECSVQDDGPGIPERYHETIFILCRQLPSAAGKAVAGSGLGLALVKKVLNSYGGSIRVESDGERGTKMVFTFPQESAELPDTSRN